MLGFPRPIAGPSAVADVARGVGTIIVGSTVLALSAGAVEGRGGADTAVQGVAISVPQGDVEGRGGADIGATGQSISFQFGQVVSRGGADVSPVGQAVRLQENDAAVTGGAGVPVTGLALRMQVSAVVTRGGADVGIAGLAMRLRSGEAQVITVTPQFFELVTRPDQAGQYLVEISAIKGTLNASGGGEGPIADARAVSDVRQVGAPGVDDVQLLLSDRWWVGDPTEPVKANVEYEARVNVPLIMDREIDVVPERGRRVQRQVGFVEIANGDGALDSVVTAYAVDGQEVLVRYGPLNGEYKDFSTIARMRGLRFEGGGEVVRLAVRDEALPLSRPMQETLYTGDGGQGGTAELEGKGHPQCYGECFNVSAVGIAPTIYQVHDGQIESIDAVYDKGAALALDISIGTAGDVADYAALIAAAPSGASYVTCLAIGMFKLGSSPVGAITADVKGDKSSGTYASLLGEVAQRIMLRKGNVGVGRINATSWDNLPAYKVGLHVPSGSLTTTEQALDELVGSIGATWGASRAGLVRAQQVVDPSTQAIQRTYDEDDILDVRPIGPAGVRWIQSVGYRRNWTPQNGDELAEAVDDERKQLLKEPYSVKDAQDIDVRTRHIEALTPEPIDSLLVDAADAEAVAQNLLEIHGTDRSIFEVVVKRIGFLSDMLEITQIVYPRFGMSGGRTFAVIGIRENGARDEVTLRLWG